MFEHKTENTHWTTFNDLLTIGGLLVDSSFPGEVEKKLRILMPWVKDHETDPIPLSTLMYLFKEPNVYNLVAVDKHPDVYKSALKFSKNVLSKFAPERSDILNILNNSLNALDSNDEVKLFYQDDPTSLVLSSYNVIQDKNIKDANIWIFDEFLNIFGVAKSDKDTIECLFNKQESKDKPQLLNISLLSDLFSDVEKQGVMVRKLVMSDKTRTSFIHQLSDYCYEPHVNLKANRIWGGYMETCDSIPDGYIAVLGDSGIMSGCTIIIKDNDYEQE